MADGDQRRVVVVDLWRLLQIPGLEPLEHVYQQWEESAQLEDGQSSRPVIYPMACFPHGGLGADWRWDRVLDQAEGTVLLAQLLIFSTSLQDYTLPSPYHVVQID